MLGCVVVLVRVTDSVSLSLCLSVSLSLCLSVSHTARCQLRYDDLISDNEMSLLKCLKLRGFDDIKLEPLLPVLLTLEGIEKVLDEVRLTGAGSLATRLLIQT